MHLVLVVILLIFIVAFIVVVARIIIVVVIAVIVLVILLVVRRPFFATYLGVVPLPAVRTIAIVLFVVAFVAFLIGGTVLLEGG